MKTRLKYGRTAALGRPSAAVSNASIRDFDLADHIARPSALALAFRHVAGRWPIYWTVGALESLQKESLNP